MSSGRLRFLREIAKPAWKYAVALPFAGLGLMQAIRDEVLAPEVAAQYRFFELLDWPWEWYVIAFIIVVLVLSFEGAFRAVAKKDAELSSMKNQILNSINASPRVNADTEHETGRKRVRLGFAVHNPSPYGIHCKLSGLGGNINQYEIPILGRKFLSDSGFIPAGSPKAFFCAEIIDGPEVNHWKGDFTFVIKFGPTSEPEKFTLSQHVRYSCTPAGLDYCIQISETRGLT